jgi:uracil-DNA glycosylase family 4
MSTAAERREELKAVWRQASSCTNCPQLAATRKTVVFGSGHADADLMFVGEAPGAREDEQGVPFVGQAGRLLDTLLGEIGLSRGDAFTCNVLKCLRYDAPVQLGDGSWERIGRLVRTGYAGTVMSVDADGRLVPRRVTGWHATPLASRRVFRLSFRNAKPVTGDKVDVELTGDHPVMTERGFVPAAELLPTDRVATGQGLSDLARDVLCGSLLGDASIGRRTGSVSCSHSERQSGYAAFKAGLMAELEGTVAEGRVAAAAGGETVYGVVHLRTKAHRAVRLLRAEFYGEEKVVPDWIADELNPRMLAFWFMDDGYCRIRGGGRRPLAEIATNGFSDADRQVLLHGLQRLGLPAKAARGRLFFDVATTEALSELIAPYVPPSMRYKLHPEVAERVPFDSRRLEPGPARVMYDAVEVEDVTDRMGADRTFFCIDVEETHNFVTAGGVVHNCRPPQNRDPLPQEIDACQGYLLRQVELIQPRVICTLGNFATKLLRGDQTGITRLHGREEVRRIGQRAVRLYPLYHPAAALYTPSMLDTLRADFARIPELLAQPAPPQPEPEAPAAEAITEPELAAQPSPPERPAPEAAQLGLF